MEYPRTRGEVSAARELYQSSGELWCGARGAADGAPIGFEFTLVLGGFGRLVADGESTQSTAAGSNRGMVPGFFLGRLDASFVDGCPRRHFWT